MAQTVRGCCVEEAKRLFRLPGDFGNWLLGAVFIFGVGATVVAAFFQVWAKFPLWVKALGVVAVIAMIVLLIRTWRSWWPWLKRLLTPSKQGGGFSQTLIQAQGGISGQVTATGNLMQMGVARPPVAALAPMETTPALLRDRAARLKPLCDRLEAFLFERNMIRKGIEDPTNRDWAAMNRSMEAARRYDEQTWALYRRDFISEVVGAYEEARSRGFVDPEMERTIDVPAKMDWGHPSFLPQIAQRLRIIALQMEQRANDMESGETTV
jgi:hypothetical protein